MEIIIDKNDNQNFELDELEDDHAEEECASKSITQLKHTYKRHLQVTLQTNRDSSSLSPIDAFDENSDTFKAVDACFKPSL